MNIATTGADLSHAAAWAAKIAAVRNPSSPILAGVRIEVHEDGATLSATNGDVFGRVALSGMVLDEGSAVVSAGLLAELAKLIPASAEVSVSQNDRGVEVKSGRSMRWVLPELDAESWPAFPQQGDKIGEVSGDSLAAAVDAVSPAVSVDKDGVRELLGIEFTFGETLELAATDRYRVATTQVPWREPRADALTSVVLPGAAAKLGASLPGSAVAVHTNGNMVTFSTGTHSVCGRLLAERYIKWRPLVEVPLRDAATTAIVDTSELLAVAKRAAVGLTQFQAVLLAFDRDSVTASKPDDEDGLSDHEAGCELSGPPIEVAVKPDYVRDAMAGCGTSRALITLTDDPRRPFVVRPVDGDGEVVDGYRCLVMVMDSSKVKAKRAA